MNRSTIALLLMFLIPLAMFVGWASGHGAETWPTALSWALYGILVGAIILFGVEERRREKAADPWVDNPGKSKVENWLAKRRQRFSVARGIFYFVAGLVAFSVMVMVKSMMGEVASLEGAILFIIGASALAGLFGLFTDNVPL